MESKKWTVSFTRYGLVFLVVLTLGYLSSRPGYIAYLDLSRNKINTLHPEVQDVLKKLDGSPVTVTLYTNLFNSRAVVALPQNRIRYINEVWENYIRFYPNLNFKYEYYYDILKEDSSSTNNIRERIWKKLLISVQRSLGYRRSLFRKASEMENIDALRKEDLRMLMELEYKGKKTVLRNYTGWYCLA